MNTINTSDGKLDKATLRWNKMMKKLTKSYQNVLYPKLKRSD